MTDNLPEASSEKGDLIKKATSWEGRFDTVMKKMPPPTCDEQ